MCTAAVDMAVKASDLLHSHAGGQLPKRSCSKDSILDARTALEEGYTFEDVAEHCTEDDCWIALNGKVRRRSRRQLKEFRRRNQLR